MTGVNPSVGCVVVSKNKTIISTGSTGTNGSPHAEKVALDGINIKAGSTLYTTLEPCFHSGKNPPCVNEIIKSGVKRVVVASLDKNHSLLFELLSDKGSGTLIRQWKN